MGQNLYNNWPLVLKIIWGNLDNYRLAVEASTNRNWMGYICPINTFLQLKHYVPRIYLALISTAMKI